MTTNATGPEPAVLGPDEFPIPFGIEADTGSVLQGLTEAGLDRIDPDRTEVRDRGDRGGTDHLAISDVDPNNLEEAGWCVVFAKDADPAVKKALEPLLTRIHRADAQAGLGNCCIRLIVA